MADLPNFCVRLKFESSKYKSIPAVQIFAFLELGQIISFPQGTMVELNLIA
jgi:hypothetical protein